MNENKFTDEETKILMASKDKIIKELRNKLKINQDLEIELNALKKEILENKKKNNQNDENKILSK